MRFRSKVGEPFVRSWSGFLLMCVTSVLWAWGHRSLTVAWIALPPLGAAALSLGVRWVYWELTPSRLIVRRLWKRKEIPWNEVTEVGWLGPMSGTFRINVGHRIEDYDRLYFEPSDQAGLAAALRKFATHATFNLD